MSAESSPLISVVIPAFKARNYLAQSLESVAAQTYRPLELLVIDDCSPEPIDDIIAEYEAIRESPPVRVIRHERNGGLGASRNTGIKEAKGEYIALLDHDDLWAPSHVSSLFKSATGNRADLAFCSSKQFREDPDDELGYWGPYEGELEGSMDLAILGRSFITPSATLIKRSLLLEVDGFDTDPKVHMCEDQDLWLRLLKRGAKFTHVSDSTAYYRKHSEAATSRPGYMAFQSAYVVERHVRSVNGPWFRKQTILAHTWWKAWLTFQLVPKARLDILLRAIWHSLPVPWEIGRGIKRYARLITQGRRPV